MSRRWLLDLDRNVRRVLAIAHGGTGNARGYATAVVQALSNGAGASLPVGTVVALKGSYDDRRVIAAATEDGTDVLGVVVGSYEGDDGVTFTAAAPSDHGMVAVMTAGTTRVIIGSAVTRGQYAYVHATDGAAKSSATLSAGAFGRFFETASSGSALVALGVFAGAAAGASVSFATPAIALGSSAAAGAASTVIRSDSTIAAFDGTSPSTQAMGDSAATGSATFAARRDHKHAMPSFAAPTIGLGTAAAAGSAATSVRSDATIAAFDSTAPATQAFGDAAATGAASYAARRDHVHGMPASPSVPSFATPAIVLGSSAADGAASTVIRSDATIAAFDATVPVTQGFGDAAGTGAAAYAARRDHTHGMPSATDIVDSAPSAKGFYGDGSDGSATLDGSTAYATWSSRSGSTYTMTRDAFLTALTIQSGVVLDTAGYILCCRGTLTNAGTIRRAPNNGGTSGAGASLTSKSLGGSANGGGGGGVGSGTANGSNGSTNTTLGWGGGGGNGGVASGGGTGGNGGPTPAIAAERGNPRHLPFAGFGWVLGSTGSGLILGGAGGGGGAGQGILGGGGGGGGGGGVVLVKAHKLDNSAASAVIHADGGAGGNGAVNVGWGGGGGGGGGGVVILLYDIIVTGSGAIRAAGGAKGTAPGGAPATDGTDGSTGKVVYLAMS